MAGALGKLVPLVLLAAFVGGFAWVGYQMYIFSHDLANRGKKHMEKKNINLTKGGMRVGVKHRSEEEYADRQQEVLVKTWNLSGGGGQDGGSRPGTGSRASSSSSRPAGSRTTSKAG